MRALRQFVSLYESGVPVASDCIARPTSEAIDALRRELHSLGGASAAVGADGLSEQASELGRELREYSTDEIIDHIDRITPALKKMLSDLDKLLDGVKGHLVADD